MVGLIVNGLLIFTSFNCVNEKPIHNLLTVKETSEYLRIPRPTVYYLAQRGQIPAIQIGGRWRIKKSALDRDILREDKQGQPTVLVVDDDLVIQELFKTFLKIPRQQGVGQDLADKSRHGFKEAT